VTNTPAFWQFAGAYLHQDWAEVHGDEWRALDSFIAGEPHLAPSLPEEIEQILREHRSEAELATFVDGQGAAFLPSADQGGYHGWLTEVARRVRAATGQS